MGKAEGGSWAAREVCANGERGQLGVGVSDSEKGHLSTELLEACLLLKGNFPISRAFPGLVLTKIISAM